MRELSVLIPAFPCLGQNITFLQRYVTHIGSYLVTSDEKCVVARAIAPDERVAFCNGQLSESTKRGPEIQIAVVRKRPIKRPIIRNRDCPINSKDAVVFQYDQDGSNFINFFPYPITAIP